MDRQDKKEWNLILEEDFRDMPDPAIWNFDTGFLRNLEPQYYRPENISVKDSCLVIEARREHGESRQYDPSRKFWLYQRKTYEFTSGSLTTLGKFSFLYGRLEVRAKLPKGQGAWPALWLMGANYKQVDWPRCGEIDLMENWSGECQFTKEEHIHATVHYFDPVNGDKENRHTQKGFYFACQDPYSDFHDYAFEWDENKIDFFFDGFKYYTFKIADADSPDWENPFHKPMYLLINLALYPALPPTPDTEMPYQFLVDSIRVYQKNTNCKQKGK